MKKKKKKQKKKKKKTTLDSYEQGRNECLKCLPVGRYTRWQETRPRYNTYIHILYSKTRTTNLFRLSIFPFRKSIEHFFSSTQFSSILIILIILIEFITSHRPRKFMEPCKIDMWMVDELISLTRQFRMQFLNDYSASKRSFWPILEVFTIQARAATTSLVLKLDVNLTSSSSLTAKTFRRQY